MNKPFALCFGIQIPYWCAPFADAGSLSDVWHFRMQGNDIYRYKHVFDSKIVEC